MGRFVNCGNDVVWKYAFGVQPAELHRIPSDLGVGEHHFIVYEEDGYPDKWKPVDPSMGEFEAEYIKLTKEDLEKMESYVSEKTQPPSLLRRFFGKKEEPDYFTAMVAAIVEYGKGKEILELQGEI